MKRVAEFVKERRKEAGLTQEEFAERVGVALTVVRKIEQGKTNLNMDKVNLVLKMFGHELAAVSMKEVNSSKS
jgi:y4mF family transcriptional regulator